MSLVPSVTETLLEWGVPVVACTRFCEQPSLMHVGGTKDPDLGAIVALAPDLVVMDREENRREDAEALKAAGVQVHVTHVVDVDGVASMLLDLAKAVGAAIDPLSVASMPVVDESSWASAAILIWRRPWISTADATYGSAILRRIGVTNVLADAENTYPEVTLEGLAGLTPTFVLLPSEPYPFADRHVAEVADGVPGATPVLLDGRDLFWWGARTPGAIGRLRAVLRGALPPS